MSYVDGFILCIPKNKLKEYKKMATDGKKTWMKFGAVDYKECMADDVKPTGMGGVPFPKLANAKPTEVVFFSYIVFKNKKHRDTVNKKVMAFFDKKYKDKDQSMPFDMNRFSYGGFKSFVEA